MKLNYIKYESPNDIQFYSSGCTPYTREEMRSILQAYIIYEGTAESDRQTFHDACYNCFPEYSFQVYGAPPDLLLGSCYTLGSCIWILVWKEI